MNRERPTFELPRATIRLVGIDAHCVPGLPEAEFDALARGMFDKLQSFSFVRQCRAELHEVIYGRAPNQQKSWVVFVPENAMRNHTSVERVRTYVQAFLEGYRYGSVTAKNDRAKKKKRTREHKTVVSLPPAQETVSE